MPKPVPIADEVSKPFWDAVNKRQLILQRCSVCGRMQYPPVATCGNCGAENSLEWVEVSGRGKILGSITVHDTRLVSLQAETPLNVAVIALEDDPDIKFFSNLPGIPVDEVPVGASVQVEFQEAAPGQLIHEWRVVN